MTRTDLTIRAPTVAILSFHTICMCCIYSVIYNKWGCAFVLWKTNFQDQRTRSANTHFSSFNVLFFFHTFTHNPSCPDFHLDSAVSCERVERRSGLGKCNSAVNDRQMSNQDNRCRDASVQTTNSPFVSRFCVVNIQMCWLRPSS